MSRRNRRRAFAVLALSAWAIVLGWHAKREYVRPLSVRLAEASANIVPADAFYTVRLGGATIGYASARIDTLPDGFLLSDDLRLRVSALGRDAPALVRTTIKLGELLDLERFEFSLRSDFGVYSVEAEMTEDSVLAVELDAGGETQRMTVDSDGPILLPQVMGLHFALGGEPKPGARYAYDVFDPSIMERQRVTVEVVGPETLIYPDSVEYDADMATWRAVTSDTVETWHVRQGFGGVEIESWLDPDGLAVRSTSPLGYTIERTAFEIAWNAYRELESGALATAGPDIIEATAIAVGASLPDAERLSSLTLQLGNVDLEGFDLDGARQRLVGDTLVISAGRVEEASYMLPASDTEFARELAATPLVQSDDLRIRATARDVIGGTSDPRLAAERLGRWVYENLEKKVTLSVPSAVQVLEARQGDCNEHTVLFVALARAVGLPTRTAAGLVHVRDRFYYHAWPEVWLDDWVPLDPTLGQFPADASHLRFVIGGLARQVELVRLIGQLELDVLSLEEL